MTALASLAALADGAGQGAHPLVHLNAALNALATVLLVLGHRQIKRGREVAHGRLMLAALATSAAFLVSYLIYHAIAGSVRFTHPGAIRYIYYAVLLSHVLLAFTVPLFALASAYLGIRAVGSQALFGRAGSSPTPATAPATAAFRARHRRLVRWAYPIWLYVSVTGVLVYAMLYHLWPSADL
jgi:uncharacterized membrane protein YozB (DUF420 family)